MSFFTKALPVLLLVCIPQRVLGWDWRTKVTVVLRDKPLSAVCDLLEEQYGIHFSYSRTVVDLSRRISVEARSRPLKRVLEDIFSPYGITFTRIGTQVVLTEKKETLRTVNGYVQDVRTGEKLIGATVYSPAHRAGTVTNQYGFFSLTIPRDTASLLVSYIGYEPFRQQTEGTGRRQVIIGLQPVNSLQEVVVTEHHQPRLQEQTQMSKLNVSQSDVKAMPRLLGETDVLRTMAALPGVSGGIDGGGALNVRGGSPDQNLILLDGTPVFNSSHLFGIFSVFNPDIVKNADLYKGDFPARYGGRLSSVMDISMKDGDMKHYHGEASIGLIAAKATVEGPIVKDKTSFVVSARRSYADLLLDNELVNATEGGKGSTVLAYFYDINVKINHIFSTRDRVFLSAYSGEDRLSVKKLRNVEAQDQPTPYAEDTRFHFGWGNVTGTLRWNHVFSPQLFSNVTFNYSRYSFLTDYTYDYRSPAINDTSHLYGKYYSRIQNGVGKIDFDYRPNPRHSIRFGLGSTTHIFEPGVSVFEDRTSLQTPADTAYNNTTMVGVEMLLYAEDDWEVTPALHLGIGVHASGFLVEKHLYSSLQPRLGARYVLPGNWALKLSYTHMNQYLHLLTNNGTNLPTDLWVPSTQRVKPMFSRQVSTGIAKTTRNKAYAFSLEGYYKTMDHVIEYQDNASIFNSAVKSWDQKVQIGKGYSYGGELLLEKKTGRTRGWIGYTLAWSDRVFAGVNGGKAFPYKYDRRHDVEVVLTQKLGKRWEASLSWEYTSGVPLTLPTASYEGTNGSSPYDPDPVSPPILDHVGDRNRFRTSDMHRLDISFTYTKKKKWWTKSWTFSLYNAYNRKNPFYYSIVTDRVRQERYLQQVSILPILPSISYAIRF